MLGGQATGAPDGSAGRPQLLECPLLAGEVLRTAAFRCADPLLLDLATKAVRSRLAEAQHARLLGDPEARALVAEAVVLHEVRDRLRALRTWYQANPLETELARQRLEVIFQALAP